MSAQQSQVNLDDLHNLDPHKLSIDQLKELNRNLKKYISWTKNQTKEYEEKANKLAVKVKEMENQKKQALIVKINKLYEKCVQAAKEMAEMKQELQDLSRSKIL